MPGTKLPNKLAVKVPSKNASISDPIVWIMLAIAIGLDASSAFLGLVELVIGGVPLISGIINLVGACTVGLWLKTKGKGGWSLFGRMGGSFLLEIIPGLSAIAPTWTINVILALEEKTQILLIIVTSVALAPVLVLVLYDLLKPEVCTVPGANECGISQENVNKYESGGGELVSFQKLQTEEAKNYAINNLGIPAESIRAYSTEETADLIRAEIAKQWSQLSDDQKHGCSQLDAERGILTYAIGEASLLVHFNDWSGDCPNVPFFVECESNGTYDSDVNCPNTRKAVDCKKDTRVYPKGGSGCSGSSGTLQPLSVTCDKYQYSYSQQVAAFYDIKYTIYLGVKENINNFVNRASSSNCQTRWEETWDITFGGDWWVKGSRLEQAKTKAAEYAKEEYKCQATGSLKNPSPWYMSMCERMVSTNAPNWPDAATCHPDGRGICTNPSLDRPTCDWSDLEVHCFPYACEEISTAMVVRFYGNELDAKTLWDKIGGCQSEISNIPLIASSYGINCQKLPNNELNKEGIKKYIDQGIPVIAKGGRSSFGKGPQGTAGYTYHVVVITGIEGDSFIVNDPAFPPGVGVKYKINNWENETPGQRNGKDAWACTKQ